MSDYRRVFANGYSYYITIVTHERRPILIDNISLLRQSFAQSKKKYLYHIDAIVVLPDHIHMIITPQNATDYPKIIGSIKAYFSRYFIDEKSIHQSQSRHKKRHKAVWQKRYFEHTIRNEKDWFETLNYMRSNPVKHGLVDDMRLWEYSSFYKRGEMDV